MFENGQRSLFRGHIARTYLSYCLVILVIVRAAVIQLVHHVAHDHIHDIFVDVEPDISLPQRCESEVRWHRVAERCSIEESCFLIFGRQLWVLFLFLRLLVVQMRVDVVVSKRSRPWVDVVRRLPFGTDIDFASKRNAKVALKEAALSLQTMFRPYLSSFAFT